MKDQTFFNMQGEMYTMTAAEVAKILRIARNGVYELIHCGKLKSIRCGHQFRITPQALREFMNIE